MNDEVIQDLKQFIAATISQQLALQTEDIDKRFEAVDGKFEKLDQKLSRKIDDLDIKVDTLVNEIGKVAQDHEVRITKLEQQTA